MKQEVQLYINGQRVDLFQDETINIQSSIKNVKDIGSVFMTYSQGFNVPASKNNNKIFKHYNRNTLTNGFDARIKADAEIEINNFPFKKGKIKLNSVKMKNNQPYSYDLTFFDDTISLKDVLGDDLLSDMDFTEYDSPYNAFYVRTRLETGIETNGIPNAILCPLISSEQRLFYNSALDAAGTGNVWAGGTALRGAYWDNFKYALRIPAIIDKIQETYPEIQFAANGFFDATNDSYYDLYMWLHREKGIVTTGKNVAFLEHWGTEFWNGFATQGDLFTISDAGSGISYSVELNLDTQNTAEVFDVHLYQNGNKVQSFIGQTGNAVVNFGSLPNGGYKIELEYQNSFTVYGNNLSETHLSVVRNDGLGPAYKDFYYDSDDTLDDTFNFEVSSNLPKMKVIDFLTGLFKMFNLVAYSENGEIVVQDLDEYYDSYENEFDITQYVEVSESEIKPNQLYKNIEFGYQGLDSYITEKHNELFNLDWGTEQYALEDKYDGTDYKVEVPFEHIKLERLYDNDVDQTDIMYGWMVDKVKDGDLDGDPYIGKPLLFYVVKQTFATPLLFNDGSTRHTLTDYFVPSNSIALTDSQTINFKAEINEYAETVFTQTLFSTYYQNYVESIFDYRARITKITAYLPLKVTTKFKLNDLFIVGDKYYRINSASINLNTGKTELELQYKL